MRNGIRLARRSDAWMVLELGRGAQEIGKRSGAVMRLTNQQSAYLRCVYGLCGPKHDRCADSRAVATTIGATEDERMDLEDALAQAGYIQAGPAPGTVVITEHGWRVVH
jgi:hypothetical protein